MSFSDGVDPSTSRRKIGRTRLVREEKNVETFFPTRVGIPAFDVFFMSLLFSIFTLTSRANNIVFHQGRGTNRRTSMNKYKQVRKNTISVLMHLNKNCIPKKYALAVSLTITKYLKIFKSYNTVEVFPSSSMANLTKTRRPETIRRDFHVDHRRNNQARKTNFPTPRIH